jgi:hypothetical protein
MENSIHLELHHKGIGCVEHFLSTQPLKTTHNCQDRMQSKKRVGEQEEYNGVITTSHGVEHGHELHKSIVRQCGEKKPVRMW